eukprot:TRINITY_DN17065_c0_g1_i1.p1 TRINITY_DN17065_c0_g1~~TRINITY_DN17065_c0_g1_i1.p1  ORF type:complete len:434 (+),score=40.71 TRINITY_DN17065_c0_g1_i1:125-1426(+)
MEEDDSVEDEDADVLWTLRRGLYVSALWRLAEDDVVSQRGISGLQLEAATPRDFEARHRLTAELIADFSGGEAKFNLRPALPVGSRPAGPLARPAGASRMGRQTTPATAPADASMVPEVHSPPPELESYRCPPDARPFRVPDSPSPEGLVVSPSSSSRPRPASAGQQPMSRGAARKAPAGQALLDTLYAATRTPRSSRPFSSRPSSAPCRRPQTPTTGRPSSAQSCPSAGSRRRYVEGHYVEHQAASSVIPASPEPIPCWQTPRQRPASAPVCRPKQEACGPLTRRPGSAPMGGRRGDPHASASIPVQLRKQQISTPQRPPFGCMYRDPPGDVPGPGQYAQLQDTLSTKGLAPFNVEMRDTYEYVLHGFGAPDRGPKKGARTPMHLPVFAAAMYSTTPTGTPPSSSKLQFNGTQTARANTKQACFSFGRAKRM